MKHEDSMYLGCLLLSDAAFCEQVFKLLQENIGRSIEYIGSLDLSYLGWAPKSQLLRRFVIDVSGHLEMIRFLKRSDRLSCALSHDTINWPGVETVIFQSLLYFHYPAPLLWSVWIKPKPTFWHSFAVCDQRRATRRPPFSGKQDD
jgi:hypothetical protein